MSTRRQFFLLAIVVVIAALLSVLAWRGRQPHTDAVAPPADPPGTFRPTPGQLKSMTIEPVGSSALGALTAATGAIAADGDQSTPVFLPYSGQVARVLVDAGQVVAKGQPLLVVRTGDFVDARSALLSAQAGYQAAQAQLANARRGAERQQQLTQTAGGSQKDEQQAQTDLASAQEQERTADATLSAAREKLAILGGNTTATAVAPNAGEREDATLRAPIGGVIATRNVSPGQYVDAGGDSPLLTITNASRVWLLAQLPESAAGAVRVGDSVEMTTPAWPGRVFHARVDMVGAQLDATTHRLPVRATIANPDGALKPQMFASFSIRRAALAGAGRIDVPAVAVIHEGDSARVWVLRPDGLLAARAVKTGDQQGQQVEITSGLQAGEKIVTAGALFVNEAGLGE